MPEKKMKIEEIRKKTKAELEKETDNLRDRLKALNFDLAAGKLKNVRDIRQIKRNIARMLTIKQETGSKKA